MPDKTGIVTTPGVASRLIYVGPDVRQEGPGAYSLGQDYLRLWGVGKPQGLLWLDSGGADPLGGRCRLLPQTRGAEPGPDGIVPLVAIFIPNGQFVPEPSAVSLLLLGALGTVLVCTKRSRRPRILA